MPSNGQFSGNPTAEWLNEPGDDRRMRQSIESLVSGLNKVT